MVILAVNTVVHWAYWHDWLSFTGAGAVSLSIIELEEEEEGEEEEDWRRSSRSVLRADGKVECLTGSGFLKKETSSLSLFVSLFCLVAGI